MQDEQFIRQWNAGHDRFSADLERGLGRILRRFAKQRQGGAPIGGSYGFLDRHEERKSSRAALSPAAQASLRGFAASVITIALWLGVMLIATPAPGFASPVDAMPAAASECVSRVVIA